MTMRRFALSLIVIGAMFSAVVGAAERDPRVDSLLEEAKTHLAAGAFDSAATAAEEALKLIREAAANDFAKQLRALTVLGDAELELGDVRAAIDHYERALSLAAQRYTSDHPLRHQLSTKLEKSKRLANLAVQ